MGGLLILAAVLVNEYYDWVERQSGAVDRAMAALGSRLASVAAA